MTRITTCAGKVKHLHTGWIGCADVRLDLGLGVSIMQRVLIEGVYQTILPDEVQDKALHCLTILLGGQSALFRLDTVSRPRPEGVAARVFLPKTLKLPPEGVLQEIDGKRYVQLGLLWTHVARRGYDKDALLTILNGERYGRAANA